MSSYDAVVVLGSRPLDPATWKLPTHVYASLDRAAELFAAGGVKAIVVSGKWTINFDILCIEQPFKECDAMAEYLFSKGVPEAAIFREPDSKDSMSNLYYLKKEILRPKGMKNLLFIAAELRLNRIKYLCQRILGSSYSVTLEGADCLPSEAYNNEPKVLAEQTAFLAPMQDGDDAWLDGKFYDDPFYEAVKQRVLAAAAEEPFMSFAK